MIFMQTAVEPLPPDTPWWAYVFIALVPLLTTAVVRLYTLYQRAKKHSADLQVIRSETLRVAALPVAEVLNRSSVLYVGTDQDNVESMKHAWENGGLENILVAVNSPSEGYRYILSHPDNIFFVIVYVMDLDLGQQFMSLMAQSSKTETIPSFGIDGMNAEKKLAAYNMGFRGTLATPFDMNELIVKLSKLGFLVTITKV